jgi:hypothetical protein
MGTDVRQNGPNRPNHSQRLRRRLFLLLGVFGLAKPSARRPQVGLLIPRSKVRILHGPPQKPLQICLFPWPCGLSPRSNQVGGQRRGQQLPFYLTSGRFPTDPALPREKRFFTRFSDVTNEIVEARIWTGIHFRNADVQAADLGGEVERYIHKHLFASQ